MQVIFPRTTDTKLLKNPLTCLISQATKIARTGFEGKAAMSNSFSTSLSVHCVVNRIFVKTAR